MFVLTFAYWIWRDPDGTPVLLSILISIVGCSFAAFTIAWDQIAGILGLVMLGLSTSFFDFSSSGLENPLLAHLPPVRNPNWRVGHYFRVIPSGFMETLQSGTNQITDPDLPPQVQAMGFDRVRILPANGLKYFFGYRIIN